MTARQRSWCNGQAKRQNFEEWYRLHSFLFNNTKVGTAKVTITGKGNYTGSVSKTFSIKNNFKKATVSGISTKAFTGKNITQSITVKYNGKTLKKGTDYTVSYSNNKKIGIATVKIAGKGLLHRHYHKDVQDKSCQAGDTEAHSKEQGILCGLGAERLGYRIRDTVRYQLKVHKCKESYHNKQQDRQDHNFQT